MTKDSDSLIGRREYLSGVAAGTTLSLAGCLGDSGDGGGGTQTTSAGGGGGQENYKFGVSSVFDSAGGIIMFKAGEWWADQQENVTVSTQRAHGDINQQLDQLNTMLNQDFDALFIEALAPTATAKIAENADIPVFGFDVPTYHEDILLLTSIDNREYGERAGQQLIDVMRQQHDASTYKVVELLMDQDNTNAVQRHNGMNAVWDDAGDVEVTKRIEVDGYSPVAFQEKMNAYLQTNPEFHGVCSPLVNGVTGALEALNKHDMKVPAGESGHISFTSCDAGPPMPSLIGDGFVDRAAFQPAQYYLPITMDYAVQYLEGGQDPGVFPETGTKLTSNDFPVMKDASVEGVKLWQSQSWSPADVLEFMTVDGDNLGYPWIKTSIPVMTPDNYNDPTIYANLFKLLDI